SEAQVEVAAQVAAIKSATGLTDGEIIKIPFLHEKISGYSVAYQPGTVNLTYVAPNRVAVPNPHGPVINGQDIFKAQFQQAMAPLGIAVNFVENWTAYHINLGEVHCGSNHERA